jgi:DNA-binding winged helix-turn-helix (wHTH) protein/tetratricopeptide (TPR) repeat protein/TolB-like protein
VKSSVAIRFGPYELHPRSRELQKLGTKLKLRPQPFQVLAYLLDHAGDVVTREELHQQLWSADTFVDFEHGLNTSIKELRSVLDDSATEPRYIQTIPKLGYRFIFPVELPIPASDPVHLPSPPVGFEAIPAPAATTPPSDRKWMWLSMAAVVLLFVITLVVTRMGVFRHSMSGAASASLKPRPSIAVLGFENLSRNSENDWMSTAMAEMLGAELASGQQIRVIPSENISRMKHDLSLTPADTYGQETLGKIHNHLGTDMVATGSYLALPDGPTTKLRIVLEVQDTRTGETVAAFTQDGTEADLLQLLSSGGDNLRRTLGISPLSTTAAQESRASVPGNSEAERLYAEGLAKLRGFDPLAARSLLEKAIAADANHALSHSALAETFSTLGYDLNAQNEAKKAVDLSSTLPREDRFLIQGRYRELTHDREGAVDTFRTLHGFFPDNLDYGLRFARAQMHASHPAEALETIAALRKLPEPMGTDARLDLMESSAAERLGDMKRSQKAAAISIARARALGSRLLLANALERESWAWSNLGEQDKAIADEVEARELYVSAGDTYEAAKALHGTAMFEKNEGKFADSRKAFEEALAEFRRVGAQWDIASCSHNFGILYQEMGDLDQARAHLEEALRIQRSLNDKRGVAADLDDLSNVELSAGRLSSAKQMKEQAVETFLELGDKRGESIALVNLGEVLYQRGELASAKEKYSEAMAFQQEIAHKTGLAYSLVGLGEVLTAEDHLDEARNSTQKSLDLREAAKEEVHLAESHVQIAQIALAEAKPAEAESWARKAASIFDREKAADSSCLAYAILARSLLAQGKLEEARATAGRSTTLADKSGDHMVRFQADLVNAEVLTKSGRLADAERTLNALRDQAKREGYVAFELEARLLLAMGELQSRKTAEARTDMEKLESDARGKGFLLIARKADAALHR